MLNLYKKQKADVWQGFYVLTQCQPLDFIANVVLNLYKKQKADVWQGFYVLTQRQPLDFIANVVLNLYKKQKAEIYYIQGAFRAPCIISRW